MINSLVQNLFSITEFNDFEKYCLDIFRFQAEQCAIYKQYIDLLGISPSNVQTSYDIPFLPIVFFKSHKVISGNKLEQTLFTSSGTTGSQHSRHYVADTNIYEKSFRNTFRLFYGNPSDYTILALLPSYLERQGSSLVYMVERLMNQGGQPDNGFFLYNFAELYETLRRLKYYRRRVLLMGLTYSLLDFVSSYPINFPELIVMETGGMKGKREEMPRNELHSVLCKGFGVKYIHSEYGMTELLSQAYSKGDGIFFTPPWMQIRIRNRHDPFAAAPTGTTGGVNIIDLANIYSCSFIETQDLGVCRHDGGFEISGRFEQSDVRGCNLMYGE